MDEDIRKILKCVGRPVSFQYPGNEGRKNGVLRDRSVTRADPNEAGVAYWDVVDLIEFPDQQEKEWIRIGYYRKPHDHLVWASQTTITEPINAWKRLLVHAVREKSWFKKLFVDVMTELNEDIE